MPVRYQWILVVWLFLESLRFNQARHALGVERTDDQYFHLNSVTDTYHYGYEVTPDGNFHHERRGSEGVTYGCYGYIDSKRKLHVTHYVADRKGYRVVEPNKPIPIYLSDKIVWQAFLLPRGCGSYTGKPTSTGPELIYRPSGAASTPSKPATTTTRRTTTASTTTVSSTAATCSCNWPTSTKPTVLTPKPPTTTTMRPTTVSKATSTTTARTTSASTTTPSTTTTPQTTQSTKEPDRPIVNVDVDITIGRPSQYIYRPDNNTLDDEDHANLEQDSRAQNPSSPLIYYVPYHHNTAPPGVPSTSHGTCGSGFGYIGLAPVIFVPIALAKNLGLERNGSALVGSSDIPLRTFSKPVDGGNWTISEMLDDDGNHFGLSYSEELEQIVNGGEFNLLMQSDSFK